MGTTNFLMFNNPVADSLAFKFIAVIAGAICIGIELTVGFESNTRRSIIFSIKSFFFIDIYK